MYYIGIDLGTSAVKMLLMNEWRHRENSIKGVSIYILTRLVEQTPRIGTPDKDGTWD